MTEYWWQDLRDSAKRWHGLELIVREGNGQALEMQSGHNGRMALQVHGEPLFWATMLKDHSGVWLVYNAEHPGKPLLLPVTSADVESAKRAGKEKWISHWCRYFARQVMEAPAPLLAPRRWLLRPMEQVKPAAPYVLNKTLPRDQWRFHTPTGNAQISVNWSLAGEDFPDLQNPAKVTFIDWWWSGDRLLARYPVDAESGRVKWWRKKCREGELPPVLLWSVAGLASFVILDGHDRLQAALAEGIQPQFLVLSELAEQNYIPSEEARERVLRSLAIQQAKGKQTAVNIDAMNQSLLNLYDTRYLFAPTHSRAVLGDGKGWEREVTAYLQRHQLQDDLVKILAREE
ncbi:hypothetical protein [Enterobacter sp. Bisph1]|uniref:hypothetical protein n=1 Tax=Enterobacter sp. Bisph1 TaxID=1274399 RepID=UPI00057C2A80|nr:hypothetical protein [Enterobacter sp. Bisph1]